MQTLDIQQLESVNGGSYNSALATSLVVGGLLVLGLIAGSSSTTPRRRHCRLVERPIETVTPVYDPVTGVLLGHQVDTYIQTEEVCV